jgi:hypothetical protein
LLLSIAEFRLGGGAGSINALARSLALTLASAPLTKRKLFALTGGMADRGPIVLLVMLHTMKDVLA